MKKSTIPYNFNNKLLQQSHRLRFYYSNLAENEHYSYRQELIKERVLAMMRLINAKYFAELQTMKYKNRSTGPILRLGSLNLDEKGHSKYDFLS